MRTAGLAAALGLAGTSIAGEAAAQSFGLLDFRRSDWSSEVPAVIGVTDGAGGVRQAVIIARSPVDRPMDGGGTFRGMVIRTEIECQDRRWRIIDMTRYDRDYAAVDGLGAAAWAPLVRETPLHASIADVCDGGHDGPVGISSSDPVAVQEWLDAQ